MKVESSIPRPHVAIIGPEPNGNPALPIKRSLARKFESFPFIMLAIFWFLSLRFSAMVYRLGLYPRNAVLKHASPQLICM